MTVTSYADLQHKMTYCATEVRFITVILLSGDIGRDCLCHHCDRLLRLNAWMTVESVSNVNKGREDMASLCFLAVSSWFALSFTSLRF